MEYIDCIVAGEKWGISLRRVQQLCKNKAIDGAKKEGRSWLIPANALCPIRGIDKTNLMAKKKPLPIGISDYKKAGVSVLKIGANSVDDFIKAFSKTTSNVVVTEIVGNIISTSIGLWL